MKFSMQELLYASALTGAGVGSMHWLGLVPTVVVLLGWFLVTRKLWEPFRSFLLAIFTVGLLAVLLLPSISSRPVPKCVICWNNMRQLAITLLNYEQAFGGFPPACITDDDGKPMHSWRVLILTAIEYPELHKQYRFDEPWDSPHNLTLSKVDIPLFRCPCRNSPPGTCDYSVVITESSPMRKDFGMRSSDIQRPSHVGLLTENATPVAWTQTAQ